MDQFVKELYIRPLNDEPDNSLDAPLEMGARMPAMGVTSQPVTSRPTSSLYRPSLTDLSPSSVGWQC